MPHGDISKGKISFYVVSFSLTSSVGVSDQGVLNQLVNLYCVFPIPDGDAKRHKAYTGSGNRCPTSSLRDRSYIPCTEVLVVGVTSWMREGASLRSRRGVVWAA